MDIGSQQLLPEEFEGQIIAEVNKYTEYASDDKEYFEQLDSLLESKQMTIKSF